VQYLRRRIGFCSYSLVALLRVNNQGRRTWKFLELGKFVSFVNVGGAEVAAVRLSKS